MAPPDHTEKNSPPDSTAPNKERHEYGISELRNLLTGPGLTWPAESWVLSTEARDRAVLQLVVLQLGDDDVRMPRSHSIQTGDRPEAKLVFRTAEAAALAKRCIHRCLAHLVHLAAVLFEKEMTDKGKENCGEATLTQVLANARRLNLFASRLSDANYADLFKAVVYARKRFAKTPPTWGRSSDYSATVVSFELAEAVDLFLKHAGYCYESYIQAS